MMKDKYLSIKEKSEGLYKEKGSKFLAFAYPVADEDSVKDILNNLKKQYYDARHHCYAYIIGADASQYRANDDGEPNHSAGDPILGQIRSLELTNTLVVVVRYFGGTKLGVSGLINAYKTSAAQALAKAQIIDIEVTQLITLKFIYPETNEVMKLVGNHNIKISNQEFAADCTIEGNIPLRHLEKFKSDVDLLIKLGNKITLGV